MTPKKTEEQIKQVSKAWKELRPSKSFADMTRAEFDATAKPSLDTRDEIADLRVQLKDAIKRRNAADKVSVATCQDVGRAVAGDKSEGPDSPFYKALGYVTTSERKSGLARKKKALERAA
jgi:hypothetical protein